MSKPVILTGIRSNDDLQIGNYFGALLPMIDMAKNHSEKYQINLFVPDLHSITTTIDYAYLYERTINNLKFFVAAGLPLNNPDIHIYRQSFIPAHSELTWILECFTGFGEMSRMTQFKDKSLQPIEPVRVNTEAKLRNESGWNEGRINRAQELQALQLARKTAVSVGLFNYPILMAADILLYDAKYVPIGDDQTQHLEFARDIAERMNKKFGDLFVVPEPVAKQHEFFGRDKGLRIMDLLVPTKKMSKSADTDRGVIFLSDKPDDAAAKIMGAATDSEAKVSSPDKSSRPGVANLLQILHLLDPDAGDVSQMNYKEFKAKIAEEVSNFLENLQGKLAVVDEAKILAKLEQDEVEMSKIASRTLLKVQKAVGLR